MGGLKRRKALKRLQRRIAAFTDHGETPTRNPGKETPPMLLHKPGSNNK